MKRRRQIVSKLSEVQAREQLNQYGNMVGSLMTVNVAEARDLQSNRIAGVLKPYVILSIEGQRAQTEFSEG